MPEYVFSGKRKSWEFYEKQQEEALKSALNSELWAWLEEQTKEDAEHQSKRHRMKGHFGVVPGGIIQ